MTITRDIVLDLLPLYAAGEASAESRAAVEAFVARDATVAALLRALQETRLGDAAEAEPSASLERTAINRTRAVVRRRAWVLGLAIWFTLLPLTTVFQNDGITFFMLRDHPQIAAVSWVGAAFLWWQHYRLARELKSAGL